MRAVASALATLLLLAIVGVFVVRSTRAQARRVWIIAFTLVAGGGVTMMITHSFVARWGFRGDDIRDGLLRLMDGTGYRPFVYRRLAPDIVRVVTDGVLPRLPGRAAEYLTEHSALRRYRVDWLGVESWTLRKAVAFHVAYCLVWASLFGTLLVAAALLRTLRQSSWFESIATALLAMCFVPLMFVGGGYLYDATELLLWTGLLLAVVRGWTFAIPVLFGLMLVNKESALLAVPALFPLLARRNGAASAARWTASLGLLGCAWLWYVRVKFAADPGQPREFWLLANLQFWSKPSSYLGFAQLFSPGLPSPRGANVVMLVLLFIPIRFGWNELRSDLRWAMALIALLLVPLFFVSCYLDEVRNLSLLFPFFYLVGVEGVHAMTASESA